MIVFSSKSLSFFCRFALLALSCTVLLVTGGCSGPGSAEPEQQMITVTTEAGTEITVPLVIPPAPSYTNPANWVKMGATESILPEFEVFYVYPTLFQNKMRPVMDHRFERIRTKALNYIDLTFGLLTDPVHPLKLYAPFVRQADYSTALETDFTADLGDTLLRYGIEDTKAAFRYFMDFCHKPGMPYILVGHSQGASDLYELLRSTPEITPESGFVAAYLAGLPKKTAEEIDRDFAGRDVRRGTGADDVGVILSWNTVSAEAGDNIFTVPGGFVINPLTWTTDDTPPDEASLPGKACFYVSEKEPAGTFKPALLAGTRADPERGALVVDLPGNSQYDANGQMGKGIFHANDLFFFADPVRDNMVLRANAWREKYGGAEQ